MVTALRITGSHMVSGDQITCEKDGAVGLKATGQMVGPYLIANNVDTKEMDAGTWDLGYPRTVQRLDGKIVTAYYFNDRQQDLRYIAATIWDPVGK